MKISYNQLKEYIKTNKTAEEIAVILTQTGLETEGIENFESVKGGLEGFVIAEVLTKAKHPNADKLSVTTVDLGDGNPVPVVCGASNVAAGQKVVMATVGTKLYDGDKSLTIKKAKLRGEPSEGMICAEDELGLGESHDGIMVLPENVKTGTKAKDYFSIETDKVINIDLTPNRADGASHFGVARDLYAYLKYRGEDVEYKKPSVAEFKVDNNNLKIPVEIKNTEACKRYAGVTITNATVEDSPQWLQNRLKAIGLKPINAVVDITNFVLHETGQPLHAFNADQITGNKVIVDTLEKGTPFTTLDEEDRKLTANDLMICNTEKPMCIGGVFGGMNSGVSKETKNIFLESALFDSVYIRKTAKHHALQTDASYRFERGVDPEMTLYALKRAAILIKEITGGEISSEIVDLYPEKIKKAEVNLSYKNAERLIGTKIPKEDIKRILNALEIEVEQETEEELRLKIPTYRIDVTREADVIEEILRIYGYNNIEVSHKVKSAISYEKKPNKNKLQNIVSDFLSADGFSEAMSNSLTKSEYYKKMPAFNHEQSVKILNPLSNDLDVMRQSLIFGGLEAIKRNINHRNENIRLYEFGNVYQFSNTENGALENYTEKEKLAVFLSGNKNEKHWKTDEQKFSFYDLKSHVERILTRIGFDTDSLNVTETDNKNFALGISIRLNKKIIAEYGQLSTVLCKHFDIEQDVFYAEFYLSNLIASLPANATYKKISKYPSVRRDLALLVDKSIRFEQIKTIAEKANKKLLKKTDVFDIFEDKKLGKGKKSYAVSFIFQDEQKTLKDKQINKIMDKIIKNCQSELGAEIR